MSISKDPADIIDVVMDWAAQMALDEDTIDTSEWRLPGSLDDEDEPVPGWLQIDDEPADSHTDTAATVWVSGGTAYAKYALVNTITTDGGRTLERTVRISVYDR